MDPQGRGDARAYREAGSGLQGSFRREIHSGPDIVHLNLGFPLPFAPFLGRIWVDLAETGENFDHVH